MTRVFLHDYNDGEHSRTHNSITNFAEPRQWGCPLFNVWRQWGRVCVHTQTTHDFPGTMKQDKCIWLGCSTATEIQRLREGASHSTLCRVSAVWGREMDKTHLGAGSLKKLTKSAAHTTAASSLLPPEALALPLIWKCLCINTLYYASVKQKGCVSLSCPWGVKIQVLNAFLRIPCREMYAALI